MRGLIIEDKRRLRFLQFYITQELILSRSRVRYIQLACTPVAVAISLYSSIEPYSIGPTISPHSRYQMPKRPAIIYHKLETKFLNNHVQHTMFHPDASQGARLVKVVETWHRGRELGRGSSGTVFLERSEKGEPRAVKDIAKDKNSRIKVDYRRELEAMAVLGKVREYERL